MSLEFLIYLPVSIIKSTVDSICSAVNEIRPVVSNVINQSAYGIGTESNTIMLEGEGWVVVGMGNSAPE